LHRAPGISQDVTITRRDSALLFRSSFHLMIFRLYPHCMDTASTIQ
jgi:hypothetical protein